VLALFKIVLETVPTAIGALVAVGADEDRDGLALAALDVADHVESPPVSW
jgi:hypothetical protein